MTNTGSLQVSARLILLKEGILDLSVLVDVTFASLNLVQNVSNTNIFCPQKMPSGVF